MSEFKIGQRVMATIRDAKLSDYYGFSEMPGTILRFRNSKARVELDDTGSQDSEGYNSYHDFELADLKPGASEPIRVVADPKPAMRIAKGKKLTKSDEIQLKHFAKFLELWPKYGNRMLKRRYWRKYLGLVTPPNKDKS